MPFHQGEDDSAPVQQALPLWEPLENKPSSAPRKNKTFIFSPKESFVLLLLEVSLLGLLFFVGPPISTQATITSQKAAAQEHISSDRLIELTNRARNAYDMGALSYSNKLSQAAAAKAVDIMNSQYFDHTSPNGKKFSYWIKETKYAYTRVGENLAIRFNSSDDIMQAWMESASHRQNILNPFYKEIGIASLTGIFRGKQTTVVVQMFGTPR